MNPQDIETIRAAILKNAPPHEQALAIAAFNVGIHALNQIDRLIFTFERIATAQERIATLRG